MSKYDNMLSILWLLTARKKMTAKQLAEELEINIRTVYRYIDALCASGIPIIADSGHNGGYELLDEFKRAPLFFTTNEQSALLHASTFAREAGYPFSEALDRAISKLMRHNNEAQLNEINKHVAGFEVIQSPSDPSLYKILKEIEYAVAEGYTINIHYESGYTTLASIREVDPYGLVYWRGNWYTVAYCHLRKEIRSFRADRIRIFTQTGKTFSRPVEFSSRQYLLENLLPHADQAEDLVSVRIQGTPQAICDLCGHWLFGHAVVERTADQLHVKLSEFVVSMYVPHMLLHYGTSIEVIEPLILKEKMVAAALKIVEHYQKNLPDGRDF